MIVRKRRVLARGRAGDAVAQAIAGCTAGSAAQHAVPVRVLLVGEGCGVVRTGGQIGVSLFGAAGNKVAQRGHDLFGQLGELTQCPPSGVEGTYYPSVHRCRVVALLPSRAPAHRGALTLRSNATIIMPLPLLNVSLWGKSVSRPTVRLLRIAPLGSGSRCSRLRQRGAPLADHSGTRL